MAKSEYWKNREVALDRDGGKCRYCGREEDDAELQTHHVEYEQFGGSDDVNNLVTLCKPHHGLAHSLGESGDDPVELLEEKGIATDWPEIRGLDSPASVMVLDDLQSGRGNDEPWGYVTAQSVSEETGLPHQHATNALKSLVDAGWARKQYHGLYEFVADPREGDDGGE